MSGSSSSSSDAWVTVSFADSTADMTFDGMTGREELGRPFLYVLELSAGVQQSDIGSLIGTSCTVKLGQSADAASIRYFNGKVTRIISQGLVGGAIGYQVELRPWIWLLTRVKDCKIFQNMTAFDIITDVCRSAGYSDFSDGRQASAGSQKLEYCVQYDETSYDFIMRLMEKFGIYYYFKHADGKHTLVFSDDPNSHTALTSEFPFTFDQTEIRTVADHIWELRAENALQSGKFMYRDYNFTTPSLDLEAKAIDSGSAASTYEVYEYPGDYDTADIGTKLTDIRLQALTRDKLVANAHTNSRLLHPGWRFTLSEHPYSDYNQEYLVTGCEFSLSIAEGSSNSGGETVDTYKSQIKVIPGSTPFRLRRETPRPRIAGPQTAKVVGATGDEICTDEYGRIKVQFPWDRVGTNDDQSSCWIRVAQSWAGTSWGSIFIPRVGMEVLVEFLEGDPDRPLITGAVYNALTTVPYALPDNKTRSTIKSNSSTGGNGFNEFRFEDKAGSEEVFFQAQKDYNKVVLNNETVNITQDTTTTVKQGNRSVTVSQGNDSHTVSEGNRSVTISQGNDSLTVSLGNMTISVGTGKIDVSAAQSITLTVGGSTVKLEPAQITLSMGGSSIQLTASGVSVSGPEVQINGNATVSVQAPAISLN